MNNTITILDWDSKFFEKNICRVDGSVRSESELFSLFELLEKQHIDLAYYSSVSPIDTELAFPSKYSIKLVGKKITYQKAISDNIPFSNSVVTYTAEYPEPKLLDLAIEGGMYSRFKADDNIDSGKFEQLYRTWIINSVNKKIAREVLVFNHEDTIAGLVTLGEKKSRADIGIIAVDVRFRGRGIGKSLTLSAESWFHSNTEFENIQVVTQGANIAACKLYESCGYDVDKVEYVYHLWKRDNA